MRVALWLAIALIVIAMSCWISGCSSTRDNSPTSQVDDKDNHSVQQASAVSSLEQSIPPTIVGVDPREYQFYGICYGPFRGNQNPSSGPYPDIAQVKADLQLIKQLTNRIRFYSAYGKNALYIEEALHQGFEVMAGCWISKEHLNNSKELGALLCFANRKGVNILVVGNEVLLRQDLSKSELIKLIRYCKSRTNKPVGYADIVPVWLDNPDLAKSVDVIIIHNYGYWNGFPVDQSAEMVVDGYRQVKKRYPNKLVILGETGWPKAGTTRERAECSVNNQKRFIDDLLRLGKKEGMPYFYFEAFDEQWKVTQEGDVGEHWGLWFLKRGSGEGRIVIDKFPFIVYDEPKIPLNFIPSGWMGDIQDITLDIMHEKSPHSGRYCINVQYQPKSKTPNWVFSGQKTWAGIYWQYPENNWGSMAGYQLKGVKQLTFWARGSKGGELAEFKIGGISGYMPQDKKFADDFFESTGVVKLSKRWQKFTIPIPKSNLDCVIGGFCWVTNIIQSPQGQSIFLDDIQYE